MPGNTGASLTGSSTVTVVVFPGRSLLRHEFGTKDAGDASVPLDMLSRHEPDTKGFFSDRDRR